MTIESITKETVEMIKRQFRFGAIIARVAGFLGLGTSAFGLKIVVGLTL